MNEHSIDICILGGAGFGGGELMRLLINHPHMQSIRAVSRTHAGEPVHAVHPHLRGLLDITFESDIDWQGWETNNPVVFSAMPSLALAQQYRTLEEQWRAARLDDRLTLIDLSGDFRLKDAQTFERHYGKSHPCPEALGSFIYGLCEQAPERLRGATRIANPGCFATAIDLALLPLAGLPSLGRVCISAMTGSSGSGATPSPGVHHAMRAHDLRAYKVLTHQHLGEIEALLANAGTTADLAFVPHSAPIVRGIFATLHLDLRELGLNAAELKEKYATYYADSFFVQVVENTPRIATLAGTNRCEIACHTDGHHGVILAALDNLGKGMAGQAVQNLNLTRGGKPQAGLRLAAAFPG